MTSSRYNSKVCHWRPFNTFSISLSNVAGAEVRPKGNTFHCHSPPRVTKADFYLASWSKGTCQYPLTKSRVLKYILPVKASKLSSILGRGYSSFLVTALSRR